MIGIPIVVPTADSIPYDNSSSTLTSTSVRDALDELDGAGGGGPDNFSYEVVATATTVTVPLNQLMIVNDNIDVVGTLDVIGHVLFLA